MRKWTVPTLGSIVLLAIMLRVRPLFDYIVWGSDSGEYFSIASGLVENGHLSTEYSGWGLAYPFFPGTEVLVGSAHWMTGLDLLGLLLWMVPVVGALGVALVFLIGRTAFGDVRVGLIAASLLAVAMPHVFATSHSMPGTLGDLLAMLCILLLLKAYDDRRAVFPLLLATLALVPTHHLSTFFVLVPVLFAVFVREIIRERWHSSRLRVDAVYITFLMSATLSYWLLAAAPFRDEVMSEAFGVSPFMVALAAVGVIAVAGIVVIARRRYLSFTYTPRYPSVQREMLMLVIMSVAILGTLASVPFLSVPGTSIRLDLLDVLTVMPIAFFTAISIIGIGPAEFSRKGFFVMAWLGSLGIVLLIGVVTENKVLIPYRQLQYFMAPMGLLAGWGLVYLADNTLGIGSFNSKSRNMTAVALISVLVLVSAATSMPSRDLLGGFEEGTSPEEMDAVLWSSVNVPVRGTMVATDHRMSSMLFGFAGLNGTWDSAFDTLHGDLNDSREELLDVDAPAGKERIDYVLLSAPIREGVALEQWVNAEPMSEEALQKFYEEPFQKVFEGRGVEIYFVGALQEG